MFPSMGKMIANCMVNWNQIIFIEFYKKMKVFLDSTRTMYALLKQMLRLICCLKNTQTMRKPNWKAKKSEKVIFFERMKPFEISFRKSYRLARRWNGWLILFEDYEYSNHQYQIFNNNYYNFLIGFPMCILTLSNEFPQFVEKIHKICAIPKKTPIK